MWDAKPWKIVNAGATMVSLLGDDEIFIGTPRRRIRGTVEGRANLSRRYDRGAGTEARRAGAHLESQRSRTAESQPTVPVRLPLSPGERAAPGTGRSGPDPPPLGIEIPTAERALGSGFLGLLSDIAQRGNATSKLPESTKALMAQIIEADYETLRQKSKRGILVGRWGWRCEERGLIPPSYKTFSLAVREAARGTSRR